MNKPPFIDDTSGKGHDDDAPLAGIETLRVPRAPQRDLWPGIEARIVPARRRSRWQPPLWLAAAGVAAVTLVATTVLTQRSHRAIDASTVAALRAPASVAAATLPTQDASLQQVAVIRPVHPETRALMRANLKLVNNAEVQVRKAMQSDPDAAYLQSLLATAHQQKKSLQVALSDDGE